MGWFIGFIIIGAIITPIVIKTENNKYKDYDFLFQSIYVKGFKNILDRENVRFATKDNRLYIEFMKAHKNLGLMSIDNIEKVEGVSEEYIKEGATLTRMVALGILSLGLTKTKITNRKFLLIHLNNGDLIVFEDEFTEDKVKKLNELLFAGV